MKIFLPLSFLLLLSSLGFARPAVKVSVESEIRGIDSMLLELQKYQDNSWAIGINPETMELDQFTHFFADRGLDLKYFVQGAGVMMGDATAYDVNRQVLVDYKRRIVQEEIDELNRVIADLESYKQEVSSPNFIGELPSADKYLTYFSEQRLPIQFEAVQGSISLASDAIYEQNKATLNAYLSSLQKLQEPSPAPVQ